MIDIDPKSATPIYRQIVDGVRMEVAARRYRPGDELPSVRRMAQQLRINPNTVARAYRELESLDVIETRRGSGTFVSEGAERVSDAARTELVKTKAEDLVQAALQAGLDEREIESVIRDALAQAKEETR